MSRRELTPRETVIEMTACVLVFAIQHARLGPDDLEGLMDDIARRASGQTGPPVPPGPDR